MGSQSDWETMRHAADTLDAAEGIAYEARIVSAHRTPERLFDFATGARAEGFKVIIAGAGGAAHLPGMTAAMTPLPVFGVPVRIQGAVGQDSACCRSCRCRPASRSARWPSAAPARSTPRCWPPPCWRWRRPTSPRLDAPSWRRPDRRQDRSPKARGRRLN
jgi:hypothetical protein